MLSLFFDSINEGRCALFKICSLEVPFLLSLGFEREISAFSSFHDPQEKCLGHARRFVLVNLVAQCGSNGIDTSVSTASSAM